MAKDSIPSTHPLTPPLTEEEWLDWLRLLRSRRVGVSTFFRLMSEHGSAAAALDALPEIAADAGLTDYRPATLDDVRREWRDAGRAGLVPLAYGSPAYPARLADIPDPPPILWAFGDPALASRRAVALVGARNASSVGLRMARRLAAELGEAGFITVSGLARGIDTAVHLASLGTGTVAVMAGGADVVYPAENAVLAQEISETGVRLSEMPVHLSPQARHFPPRNRIISGIAEAVIVVEAAARSGSLITARSALDQGRDVFAVPGHPFDARSSGSNMLIRDGALLVRSAQDVIEGLGPAAAKPAERDAPAPRTGPAPGRSSAETRALHDRILSRIGTTPVPEDELIRTLGQSSAELVPEIATLELAGKLHRDAGGLIFRRPDSAA